MKSRIAASPQRTDHPAGAPPANEDLQTGDLDLGILSSSLGYNLRRLQLSYKKHFLRESGSLNLQPQDVGAMFVIGLNPGVTPTQMSAALGLEGAQIATMLNKLELRRLITRRVSKSDGRSRAVHLTATGKAEFKQLRKVSTQVERSFLADTLNEAEAAQLGALLARLVASLED